MKTAIIMSGDIQQVMLTPENEMEKKALGLISAAEKISVDIKEGTLFDTPPPSAYGYTVAKCQGGYLRAYTCPISLMLVLQPEDEEEK